MVHLMRQIPKRASGEQVSRERTEAKQRINGSTMAERLDQAKTIQRRRINANASNFET